MSGIQHAKADPNGQADGGGDRRRTIVLAILAIIVIAVAVFVGLKLAISDSSQSSTDAPTTQQITAEPSHKESPAHTESPTSSQSQTSLETQPATPQPTSVTEGEGETSVAPTGLPDEAEEITTVIVNEGFTTAAFRTPSGNIGCDINTDIEGGSQLICKVTSWDTNPPVEPTGDDGSGGEPFVDFGTGSDAPTYGGAKHDGFCFMDDYCQVGFVAQALEYGEVGYYTDFVCLSEEAGLTCWNHKTGHGAFISSTEFEPY